ncbi:MAG TPA: histidine kinase [Puia sp.]|nr:histidine kinase [Puia sp.]
MLKLNRAFTVLLHACVWAVLMLSVWLWRPMQEVKIVWRPQLTGWFIVLSAIPYITLFYVNAFVLVPVYFTRKNKLSYFLLTLLAWLAAVVLAQVIAYIQQPPPPGLHVVTLRRSIPGLVLVLASSLVGISRENARLERSTKEKENEHLRTELSFLRTQVNPHFMLNVLNSMALLARKKSDLLEPVLMELARLMNYMLYDAANERISLEDEIGYLRAYIDLQMLRFGSDVKVRFNVPQHINGSCIEPMLLIPLVENAFKHGIGLIDDPVIFIDIITEGHGQLKMTVKNKYNPRVRQQAMRTSGIGLANLTKRLELIYPGRFELEKTDSLHIGAAEEESWFIITLNIPLE